MQNYWNSVKSVSLKFADKLAPVLKESKFRETGHITPEEFVSAGDFLVEISPSWKWFAGDVECAKPFLPKDKQYLITRRVPCYKRCKELEYDASKEAIISINDTKGDGDWVDTHHGLESSRPGQDLESAIEVLDISSKENEISDDEPIDLEDLDDDDMMLDTNATACFENSIEKTRTYDLHITYDKFYQTPRMWLSGYDENNAPLTNKQTYEDISQDHVNKTVTFEEHPNLGSTQMCSIHPCKHANVIKKIMLAMENGIDGDTLQVHTYMIIFLKFIQAAIPTIEYDFTRHVKLG